MIKIVTIVSLFCCLLFSQIGCYPSWKVAKNTTDQEKLARIATNLKEEEVTRLIAINRITDQKLLERLALEDENYKIRYSAAYHITDQEILKKIVLEQKDNDVRCAAMNNLADEDLLEKLAKDYSNKDVRKSAERTLDNIASKRIDSVNSIDDESALIKFATEDKDFRVRLVATNKINNEAALVKIAINDSNEKVKIAAVNLIEDESNLINIVMEACRDNVCETASSRISDNPELRVEKEQSFSFVREMRWLEEKYEYIYDNSECLIDSSFGANRSLSNKVDAWLLVRCAEGLIGKIPIKNIEKLIIDGVETKLGIDKSMLSKIALTDNDVKIRIYATSLLIDQTILGQIALKDKNDEVREAAVSYLTNQDLLGKIVMEDNNLEICEAAVKNLTDRALLAKIVVEGKVDNIRESAAMKLKNTAEIEKIAVSSSDREVLKLALYNISHNVILERIAKNAVYPAMRLAASVESGKRSWQEIFDIATGIKGSVDMMSVLEAVLLIKHPTSEIMDYVHQAALILIRRGDSSRIPELIELLYFSESKTLAEDYLNSGQSDLYNRAKKWSEEKGFSIMGGYGSNRATWGSGR